MPFWLVLATRLASFGDNVMRVGWDAALKTYGFELALGLIGLTGMAWSFGTLVFAKASEPKRSGSILTGEGWVYGGLAIIFLLVGAIGVSLQGAGHWPSWMYVLLGAISLGMTAREARRAGLWR